MEHLDWKGFGEAVRTRREDLGLTQEQAAVAADVSTAIWRIVETATRNNVRRSALRSISRSLGWGADGWERILTGSEPGVDPRLVLAEAADLDSDLDALANNSGLDPRTFTDEEKAMLEATFALIRSSRKKAT